MSQRPRWIFFIQKNVTSRKIPTCFKPIFRSSSPPQPRSQKKVKTSPALKKWIFEFWQVQLQFRNCFEYERTVQYEPRSNSWLDVPIRNNFTEGSNNCPPILKMMAQTPFRDRLALFYSRNAVSGHSIGHASHTTQCVWSISPIFQPQKLHLIETIMHKHRGPYFNFSYSSKDSCSSTLMCVRSWVWMQYCNELTHTDWCER